MPCLVGRGSGSLGQLLHGAERKRGSKLKCGHLQRQLLPWQRRRGACSGRLCSGHGCCNGCRHWLWVARADGAAADKQRQLAGAMGLGWVQHSLLLVDCQLNSALLH